MIVNSKELLRLGLRTAIEAGGDIDVVGEFALDGTVVEKVVGLGPDLVLVETGWPSLEGLVACRNILDALPSVRVIVMSATGSEGEMVAAMKAGASGCLLGTASGADLIVTIRTALNGGLSFNAAQGQHTQGKNLVRTAPKLDTLSAREVQILAMVGAGYRNHEIGFALNLTAGTVRNNITRIRTKLDLHSRAELILFAIEHGLRHDAD